MDLQQLRTFQWVTIIGAIGGVISLLVLWKSPYRTLLIVLTVVLPLATGLLELQKERVSVFFSGIRRYQKVFPVESNRELFARVENEYCYFGVSFASVINSFRAWYSSPTRRANVRIRLLITDPEAADLLEFQARYERNLWDVNLSPAQQRLLDDSVRRVRDSIALVLDTLATLPPANPPIEVYFHRERARKWIHRINEQTLYLGMLELGSDGLQAPVLEFVKHHGKTVYDYYADELESVLKTARRVTIPGQ